jgi:N-hydroxyarylamine O-acetyltransferase
MMAVPKRGGAKMAGELNINAYFERIGFAGSIAPNLQTLQTLLVTHMNAIPFENLNPLLRLPVNLDLQSLEQKLIRDRRGGWCFEHNTIFMHALRALEFEVTPYTARVLWDVPPDTITRRSHMVLMVDIGGASYLVDAGFGGPAPTAPLRMRPDVEQETPNEPFRITGEAPPHGVEIKTGETWRLLYRFDLSEQHPIDFEAPNWYLATNPNSKFFRDSLIATRPDKVKRHTLTNTLLKTYEGGSKTAERVLTSVPELRDVLVSVFGISLPAQELLDPALEKIVGGAAAA